MSGSETLTIVLLLSLTMVVAPLAGLVRAAQMTADEGGLYLVIAPPWRSPQDIAQAAGGALAGLAQAPVSVLALGTTGFVTRAKSLGAWVVLDGTVLAAWCGPQTEALQ